ncbi:MAG: RCC1 repeat-containing protein, partial [Euryarchaeota archaeon]|nr:RCC1 repeat-containing protein [Euryarchaeota archaeon]
MKRYTLLILTVLMLAPLLPFAEPTDELKEIDEPRLSSGLASPIISNNAWAVAISAGSYHTCAIHGNGAVSCWGASSNGEMGNGGTGTYTTIPTLTNSLGTGRTTIAISAGVDHTCAILDNGAVSCWGEGDNGELGNGDTLDRLIPTLTSSLGANRTAVAISAGTYHTCALLDNGSVSCWGDNSQGQLGDGTNTNRNTPTQTLSLGTNRTAVAISLGQFHTCVILDNGAVSCWGYNWYGQLGNGATSVSGPTPTPTLTSSLGTNRTAVAISSG